MRTSENSYANVIRRPCFSTGSNSTHNNWYAHENLRRYTAATSIYLQHGSGNCS